MKILIHEYSSVYEYLWPCIVLIDTVAEVIDE